MLTLPLALPLTLTLTLTLALTLALALTLTLTLALTLSLGGASVAPPSRAGLEQGAADAARRISGDAGRVGRGDPGGDRRAGAGTGGARCGRSDERALARRARRRGGGEDCALASRRGAAAARVAQAVEKGSYGS